jgi:hypothetical protein
MKLEATCSTQKVGNHLKDYAVSQHRRPQPTHSLYPDAKCFGKKSHRNLFCNCTLVTMLRKNLKQRIQVWIKIKPLKVNHCLMLHAVYSDVNFMSVPQEMLNWQGRTNPMAITISQLQSQAYSCMVMWITSCTGHYHHMYALWNYTCRSTLIVSAFYVSPEWHISRCTNMTGII